MVLRHQIIHICTERAAQAEVAALQEVLEAVVVEVMASAAHTAVEQAVDTQAVAGMVPSVAMVLYALSGE